MMPSNYSRVESRISDPSLSGRIESFGPKTICRPVAIRWTKVSDFCDLKLRLFEELKEIPLRPFIHRCVYICIIYTHHIWILETSFCQHITLWFQFIISSYQYQGL